MILEDVPKLTVHPCGARLEADRLAVLGNRLLPRSLVPQDVAKGNVETGGCRLESDRLLVLGYRLIQFLLVALGIAKVVVQMSVSGAVPDGSPELVGGQVVLSLAGQDVA